MKYFDHIHGMEHKLNTRNENMMQYLAYYLKFLQLNAGNDKIKLIELDEWKTKVRFILDKATYYKKVIIDNILIRELWVDTYFPEQGDHLSVDVMTAYYWLHDFVDRPIDNIPLVRFNNRDWWHPNGWAVFLSMRNMWWKVFFWPLVRGMAMWSKFFNKGETTDKMLWWFRGHNLYSDGEMREAVKIYVTNDGNYNNPDHPTIAEANKYFYGAIKYFYGAI